MSLTASGDPSGSTHSVREARQAPRWPEATARQPHLDGLRGLAALFVVLHHSYLTLVPNVVAQGGFMRSAGVLALGHFAVTVFIVLSGWSLALPVRDRDGELAGGWRRFLLRRAWRIVPTFWAALLFSTVMTVLLLSSRTGTHWDIVLPFDPAATARSALLLGDLWPSAGVPNHAYWSIPVEVHIYVVFPVIIVCLRKCRPSLLAATALMASVCVLLVLTAVDPVRATSTAPLYYGFFVVAALAGLRSALPEGIGVIGLRAVVIAVAVGLLGSCILAGPATVLRFTVAFDVAVALGTVAALVLASREGSRLRRALSTPALVPIGVMAFSLYLTHAPVLQLVWQFVVRPLGLDTTGQFLVLSALGTFASLTVALALFLLVERHFLRLPSRTQPPLEDPPGGFRSTRDKGLRNFGRGHVA